MMAFAFRARKNGNRVWLYSRAGDDLRCHPLLMILSPLTVFLYVFELIEVNGDFADPSSLRWGRSARTLPLPTATTRLAARSWPFTEQASEGSVRLPSASVSRTSVGTLST